MKTLFLSLALMAGSFQLAAQPLPQFDEFLPPAPDVFHDGLDGFGNMRRGKTFHRATLQPLALSMGKAGKRALDELENMYNSRGEYEPGARVNAEVAESMFSLLFPQVFPIDVVPIPKEEYASLIRQLGDAKYRTREKATRKLLSVGPQADPKRLLRTALVHEDPEVAVRARKVFHSWKAISSPPGDIPYAGFGQGMRKLAKLESSPLQKMLGRKARVLFEQPSRKNNAVRRLLDPLLPLAFAQMDETERKALVKEAPTWDVKELRWLVASLNKSTAAAQDIHHPLVVSLLSTKDKEQIGLNFVRPEMDGAAEALRNMPEKFASQVLPLLAGSFQDEDAYALLCQQFLEAKDAEQLEAITLLKKVLPHKENLPPKVFDALLATAKDKENANAKRAAVCLSRWNNVSVVKPLLDLMLARGNKFRAPLKQVVRNFPEELKNALKALPDTPEKETATKKINRLFEQEAP